MIKLTTPETDALHDYVHGKRNDDKDISEILNGAMKI